MQLYRAVFKATEGRIGPDTVKSWTPCEAVSALGGVPELEPPEPGKRRGLWTPPGSRGPHTPPDPSYRPPPAGKAGLALVEDLAAIGTRPEQAEAQHRADALAAFERAVSERGVSE